MTELSLASVTPEVAEKVRAIEQRSYASRGASGPLPKWDGLDIAVLLTALAQTEAALKERDEALNAIDDLVLTMRSDNWYKIARDIALRAALAPKGSGQ